MAQWAWPNIVSDIIINDSFTDNFTLGLREIGHCDASQKVAFYEFEPISIGVNSYYSPRLGPPLFNTLRLACF